MIGYNTVKPEMFTTFLFSRLSRITKIREIKKLEKFYLFSYLTVKLGVCRAIMGVNITTKYFKGPNTCFTIKNTYNNNNNHMHTSYIVNFTIASCENKPSL